MVLSQAIWEATAQVLRNLSSDCHTPHPDAVERITWNAREHRPAGKTCHVKDRQGRQPRPGAHTAARTVIELSSNPTLSRQRARVLTISVYCMLVYQKAIALGNNNVTEVNKITTTLDLVLLRLGTYVIWRLVSLTFCINVKDTSLTTNLPTKNALCLCNKF